MKKPLSILSWIVNRKPHEYGLVYGLLIPLYAAIYFLFPSILGVVGRSFYECLYFSTVTITTLGYGDITPKGEIGQLLSASESLLGIVLIGLFLNAVAGARNEAIQKAQEEKEKRIYRESQRTRLNGHFKLIAPLIALYRASVVQVSQPIDAGSKEYDPDFRLNDMKDLYKPTRLLRESYLQPAIFGYFQTIETLHKEICDLVKNVDLRCFPDIECHSLNLVSVITGFDYSGAILSARDTTAGDRKMADVASDMLENYDGDYSFQGSSILDGYLALYYQIKSVMTELTKLEKAVSKEIGVTEK